MPVQSTEKTTVKKKKKKKIRKTICPFKDSFKETINENKKGICEV